jgi:hypothetical protein
MVSNAEEANKPELLVLELMKVEGLMVSRINRSLLTKGPDNRR